MNGTYRIPLPPDVEPREYRPVKALLRAFDPGAIVTVKRIEGKLLIHGLNGCNGDFGVVNLAEDGRKHSVVAAHYAEITATGGSPRRRAVHVKWHAPGPIKPERAAKEAEVARPLAIRSGLIPGRHSHFMGYWYDCWLKERAKDRQTGRLIARAMARGEATVTFSDLGPAQFAISGLLKEAERKREYRQDADAGLQPFSVGLPERLAAYRDYLYWRELEALAGQREHFKPGLSDDTRTSDDEIAEFAPAPAAVLAPKPAGWWFQDGCGRSYWIPRKTEIAMHPPAEVQPNGCWLRRTNDKRHSF